MLHEKKQYLLFEALAFQFLNALLHQNINSLIQIAKWLWKRTNKNWNLYGVQNQHTLPQDTRKFQICYDTLIKNVDFYKYGHRSTGQKTVEPQEYYLYYMHEHRVPVLRVPHLLVPVHTLIGYQQNCGESKHLVILVGVNSKETAIEQYFNLILLILLYKVDLTFKSVDETLVCDHLNESYWWILSRGTVCHALQDSSNVPAMPG